MIFDPILTIEADDFRLQIGRPEIGEANIGSYTVRLDCLGGSFSIKDCTLWPGSTFADELQAIHDQLGGRAAYTDMNKDFALELKSTTIGHIDLKVDLHRRGGQGDLTVSATTAIDQSYLPAMIAAWRRYFVT